MRAESAADMIGAGISVSAIRHKLTAAFRAVRSQCGTGQAYAEQQCHSAQTPEPWQAALGRMKNHPRNFVLHRLKSAADHKKSPLNNSYMVKKFIFLATCRHSNASTKTQIETAQFHSEQ